MYLPIRECPFCGSSAEVHTFDNAGKENGNKWSRKTVEAYVACVLCRARGPLVRFETPRIPSTLEYAAIRSWNNHARRIIAAEAQARSLTYTDIDLLAEAMQAWRHAPQLEAWASGLTREQQTQLERKMVDRRKRAAITTGKLYQMQDQMIAAELFPIESSTEDYAISLNRIEIQAEDGESRLIAIHRNGDGEEWTEPGPSLREVEAAMRFINKAFPGGWREKDGKLHSTILEKYITKIKSDGDF